MSGKPQYFDQETTLFIKNIDPALAVPQIQNFIRQFGSPIKVILRDSKIKYGTNYIFVEFSSKEEAKKCCKAITGQLLGAYKVEATFFKSKLSKAFQNKNEFYSKVREEVQDICDFNKKVIAAIAPPQEKPQALFEYLTTENINTNLPISHVLEILFKKVAENAPELLSKSKRHLKKLQIDALYSMISDPHTFASFVNFLRSTE